ncbi:XrtA/PEP-CTERM system histidine kinase PrsK [Salinibius halmophilus]|uniref:XrtA/PEP-CTERM system histidine kinase PrsK n=1 Tax=Salinibius halmophilus TaxID=1853216 RepID=UPI000E669B28|nr:XrtA/PEP-CTERM system histidine kinase PrsK [Salinibius halmophilus]
MSSLSFQAITLLAYSSATFLSFLLTVYLAVGARREPARGYLALAAAWQTIWLVTVVASLRYWVPVNLYFSLEAIQLLAWVYATLCYLRALRPEALKSRLKWVPIGATGFFIWTLIEIWWQPLPQSYWPYFNFLVLSAMALGSLEQLVRNSNVGRFIKLISVSLSLLLASYIAYYAVSLIVQESLQELWLARAAMIMLSSCFIVLAGVLFHRERDYHANIGFSRPVMFYGTSTLIVSIGLVVIGVGSYYVQLFSGLWSLYFYALLLGSCLLAMAALFFSSTLRTNMRVWVSKHFFSHKYDYRKEWITSIRVLSCAHDFDSLQKSAFMVLSNAVHADAGEIKLRTGKAFKTVFTHNQDATKNLPASDDMVRFMEERGWVFAPKQYNNALAEGNELLPFWLKGKTCPDLIVPLRANSQVIGIALLSNCKMPYGINWEDLDVLKTLGREIASHMLLYKQQDEMSDRKQLDAYNKMTAFVMHDLNNVAAQLRLLSKNAEKHKTNPAFVDDMVMTVSNSAGRMQKLIQRFNQPQTSTTASFSINDALQEAITRCTNASFPIDVTLNAADQKVQSDRESFIMAVQHLLKNAQEASEPGQHIELQTYDTVHTFVIKVRDFGKGMTSDFINKQLFKPFNTTKVGKGMGIGVYLTREFFAELNGQMQVESQPGQGTTFTIELGSMDTTMEAACG